MADRRNKMLMGQYVCTKKIEERVKNLERTLEPVETVLRSGLKFKDELDTRLRELEEQASRSDRDRRVEYHGLRSEMMGQLKIQEDQIGKVGLTNEANMAHILESISGITKRIKEVRWLGCLFDD